MPERSRRIVKVAEIELDNIPELAQQKHADYVVVYTDYSRYWIVIVEEVRGRPKSEDTDKTIECCKTSKTRTTRRVSTRTGTYETHNCGYNTCKEIRSSSPTRYNTQSL